MIKITTTNRYDDAITDAIVQGQNAGWNDAASVVTKALYENCGKNDDVSPVFIATFLATLCYKKLISLNDSVSLMRLLSRQESELGVHKKKLKVKNLK